MADELQGNETVISRDAAINEAFELETTNEIAEIAEPTKEAAPPKTAEKKQTAEPSKKDATEPPPDAKVRQLTIENAKILRKLRELTDHVSKKDATIAEFEKVKAQLRDTTLDPATQAEMLRSLGLDLNEYTERMLKTGSKPRSPEAIRLAEIEKQMEESKRREQEAIAASTKAKQIEDIRAQYAQMEKYVTDNAAKYPALAAMGQGWAIVNEVHRRANAGELAPTDTLDSIAAEVEAKLSTDVEASIERLSKANLLDKYLKKGKEEGKKPPLRSLSNDQQTTPPKPLDRSKLSDYERRKLAIEESFEVKLDE